MVLKICQRQEGSLARSETEHFSSDLSESKAAEKKGMWCCCILKGVFPSFCLSVPIFFHSSHPAALIQIRIQNFSGSRGSAVCYGLEFTWEGRCYAANHNQNKNMHDISPRLCSQVGITSLRAVTHSWKQRKEEARPAHACTICWQHLH